VYTHVADQLNISTFWTIFWEVLDKEDTVKAICVKDVRF